MQIELLVGVFGGLSAAALFFVFVRFSAPFAGALSRRVADRHPRRPGDPLIMRIMKRDLAQGSRLAGADLRLPRRAGRVDPLPLVLVPHIGLVRSGCCSDCSTSLVALWALWLFREQLHGATWLRAQAVASFVALAVGFGRRTIHHVRRGAALRRRDRHTETTPYQRIVVTRWKDDLRLFLNNNLQFSSRDEYRYHEALVHPGWRRCPVRARAGARRRRRPGRARDPGTRRSNR